MVAIGFSLVAAMFGAHRPSAARADSADLIASPWVALHAGTRVRLLALPGKIGPDAGTKVNAGVEIELAEGWKTYWRMPGDAGVPPDFDWNKSANVGSVKVLYPAPRRLLEPAAETIGYKGRVVFPVEVTAQDAARSLSLKLDLELGICKEICVPAQASLAVDVPAAGNTKPLPSILADALKTVPKLTTGNAGKDSPSLVSIKADLAAASPTLTLAARFPGDAQSADVFIEAPDSIYVPMAKRTAAMSDGTVGFTVTLSAATAKDLHGKELVITLVGATGATETRRTVN